MITLPGMESNPTDVASLSPKRIESIQRGIKDAHEGRTCTLDEVLSELGLDDE